MRRICVSNALTISSCALQHLPRLLQGLLLLLAADHCRALGPTPVPMVSLLVAQHPASRDVSARCRFTPVAIFTPCVCANCCFAWWKGFVTHTKHRPRGLPGINHTELTHQGAAGAAVSCRGRRTRQRTVSGVGTPVPTVPIRRCTALDGHQSSRRARNCPVRARVSRPLSEKMTLLVASKKALFSHVLQPCQAQLHEHLHLHQ